MTTQAPQIDLQSILAASLRRELSMDKDQATDLARQLVCDVKKTYAGEALYIASTLTQSEQIARDTSIRRDFDGTRASRERLQIRWDISRSTFYRIISSQ